MRYVIRVVVNFSFYQTVSKLHHNYIVLSTEFKPKSFEIYLFYCFNLLNRLGESLVLIILLFCYHIFFQMIIL